MVTNTKNSAINALLEFGIPVNQIVDVGVQRATYELISCFPEIEHILFEPASSFYPDIEKNYSHIKYKLHKCAISSTVGACYQVENSINNDGIPTHSHIFNEPQQVDGKKIISSSKIDVHKLDDFIDDYKPNLLLKVDVDGLDLEVLKGGINTLKLSSIVIVEATRNNFIERAQFLIDHSFKLVNIVDRCLYGPAMWQFDYIFVNENILQNNPLPIPKQNFDRNMWVNIDS